ncbi:MAG: hypothetical protein IT385_24585 [Deltaproteobacteria bacterium]|nr:hypothetical protein [Deltaproteobacteria bacterium]
MRRRPPVTGSLLALSVIALPLAGCGFFSDDDDDDTPPVVIEAVPLKAACHEIPALEAPRWSPYDPDVGVAFGTRHTGLYVTRDRGRSWDRLAYNWSAEFPDAASGFSPTAIVYLDAERWIVTGAVTRGNMANLAIASRVIATTDGGRTFTPIFEGSDEHHEIDYPREHDVRPFDDPAEAVFRLDDRHVAALARGLLVGSADGGATWHTRDIFGQWTPGGPTAGLRGGESVLWQVVGDDGVGLVVDALSGVAITRDGGNTFTQVANGNASRAYLDPGGRVLVRFDATDLDAFEEVDGVWREVASSRRAGVRVESVLWFLPDGSAYVGLRPEEGDGDAFTIGHATYEDDALLAVRPVALEAGDGVGAGLVEHARLVAGRPRFILRGGLGTRSAEHRLLCETGDDVTPTPLPEAGVPDDLAPGEMAIHSRRLMLSESWDRMAFDANGHAYVAAQRALWAAQAGAPPLFLGGIRSPQDWRPDAPTAEFPEVGGVAVATDGSVVFGLNFFTGATAARRLLFIDPARGEVRRWKDFRPFQDGESGYSAGDLYDVRTFGDLVLGATALGTADADATSDVGPDARYHGLPGRGVARADGAWFFIVSRKPSPEGHVIGRASMWSGTLPREGCDRCAVFPGMIQALDVDERDVVYVLDRRQGAVFMRAFDDDGAPWQRVADGFHNPADVRVIGEGNARRVAVLDGDVFAFVPDPDRPARRGLRVRSGPGEAAAAVPAATAGGGCEAGAPCIEPPNLLGTSMVDLQGVVPLEPSDGGALCLKGSALGVEPGTIWFGDHASDTITHWADDRVCGRVALDALTDGLLVVETAGGLASNALPYLAPARDVRIRLRNDRPMVTGDLASIEGDNLGARGHVIIGGLPLETTADRIRVLIDAAFDGKMIFRKLPSTEIWTQQITVMPSELVGAIAGPNEIGGISGHIGGGAAWTLDGEPMPSGPTGDWFEALPQGRHTVSAGFAGKQVDVVVERVAYDTRHHGQLQPDGIGMPRHRQGIGRLGGQAFALLRASAWRRPAGPTAELVPGIPEIGLYASAPRAGDGPFHPGQAFDRAARGGLPDRDYDASLDLPRLVEGGEVLYSVVRAMKVTIEPDLQGVPTVTRVDKVIPMTATVAVHQRDESGEVTASPFGSVVIPGGASDGRMTGAGLSGDHLWVAMAAGGETWVAGGPVDAPVSASSRGKLDGEWEAHPLGDDILFLQAGDDDGPVALRHAGFDLEGALVTIADVGLALDGVDAARVLAWRVEDDGEVLLALRMDDGDERVASWSAGGSALVPLATLPADLPGVGATYDGTHTRYGVADLIRHEGELIVALAAGADEDRPGLWLARLDDEGAALTRELASVEADRVRCLGPYPHQAGACGEAGQILTNTQGCTLLACPKLQRLWLPQEGGAVEEARLAIDDDGLEVSYSVRFPEGWSRDTLDRGRIRTAVFRMDPAFD